MRYLFVAPMDVDEPIDAEWTQEEKTERIVTIEDSEVQALTFIEIDCLVDSLSCSSIAFSFCLVLFFSLYIFMF